MINNENITAKNEPLINSSEIWLSTPLGGQKSIGHTLINILNI